MLQFFAYKKIYILRVDLPIYKIVNFCSFNLLLFIQYLKIVLHKISSHFIVNIYRKCLKYYY